MPKLPIFFRNIHLWWRRDLSGPRLCMMMVVCDEEDYIIDHLLYHRYLGVTRAYVFLDHCTDRTDELLAELPWVITINCNRNLELEHLTQHQNKCASIALQLARKERFDWMLHIDPDEYAWGEDENKKNLEGSLTEMLRGIPSGIELVWMYTKEAVPVKGGSSSRLWSQEYFQEQPHILSRPMLNPITGKIETLNKWIGHNLGKSIVRVNRSVKPINAHIWGQRDFSPLKGLIQKNLGFHYHFVVASAQHWQRKYLKLSWESGKWENGASVPFPKQAWKDACSVLSYTDAKGYFEDWIAIAQEKAKLLVEQGMLSRENNVASTMEKMKRDPIIAIENWFGKHGVPIALTRSPAKRIKPGDVDCA